jgi:septum formation protein
MTGIAVANARTLDCRSRAVTSWVTLRAAADEEIRVYVASGEPLDKAGGYAIQGEGGRRFATRLEGSESNVIGLPIDETLALLREMQAARRATP